MLSAVIGRAPMSRNYDSTQEIKRKSKQRYRRDHHHLKATEGKLPFVGTTARNSLNYDKIMLATSFGFSTAEK